MSLQTRGFRLCRRRLSTRMSTCARSSAHFCISRVYWVRQLLGILSPWMVPEVWTERSIWMEHCLFAQLGWLRTGWVGWGKGRRKEDGIWMGSSNDYNCSHNIVSLAAYMKKTDVLAENGGTVDVTPRFVYVRHAQPIVFSEKYNQTRCSMDVSLSKSQRRAERRSERETSETMKQASLSGSWSTMRSMSSCTKWGIRLALSGSMISLQHSGGGGGSNVTLPAVLVPTTGY